MLTPYYNQILFFIENQDKFTAGIYLIIAKAISGVTFIPGAPLTVLSGAILGTFWGIVVAYIGNLIGAVLAFLLSRYLFKKSAQTYLKNKYPKINEYEDALFKKGFWTVVFLRLVPVFPFNGLNFVLALTEVKFRDYLFGTMLGMIPGTIVFVYLGESVKMFSWFNIFFAIFGIFCLALLAKTWKFKK